MIRNVVIIVALAWSAAAVAQPVITPTNFLNTREPARMCNNYIHEQYGSDFGAFAQPTCGALIRMPEEGYLNKNRCLYIFCDAPAHRLMIYSITEEPSGRTPRTVKDYGLQVAESLWVFEGDENTDSVTAPVEDRTPAECFSRPVDVAVSSCGRLFDPGSDHIFVLDEGNHRIAKLAYDIALDSLIWVESFGVSILKMPSAIDYADYADSDPNNDDIYVTDPGLSSVLRFSASGVFETSFGGWGSGLASICYPTGVAVSTSPEFPNRIYVTDSHNHRVVRYYSGTSGPIVAERLYVFPLIPWPLISSVDTDLEGNVYIVNSFTNYITVLDAALDHIVLTYGGLGYEPGQFDYPIDVYIDNHEMQVCEHFADSSGIQSFLIEAGQGKRASEPLPHQFQLYQNYPNPFNSSTTFFFDLPQEGYTNLVIYNLLGQRVRTLFSQSLPPGRHRIIWDGRNQAGDPISSGVYFSLLSQGRKVKVVKLLLLK